MSQHLRFPSHRFWTALKSTATLQRATVFIGVVLLSSFAIAPIVLAGYKPPKSSRPSGSTIGTVVRGEGSCKAGTKGKLTALAPLEQVGQTVSTHPTFVWYVPDVEVYPLNLSLYSYDSNGRLIPMRQLGPQSKEGIIPLQSKEGIMQYQLLPGKAGLTVGQRYLWEVALVCKSGGAHKVQVVRTDIEVVAMPATLQSSLAKTSDRLKRARLYAEAGFWYDALAETLPVNGTHKTPPLTITLLEDLVKLEPPGTLENPGQQYTRLKQVIEIERQ